MAARRSRRVNPVTTTIMAVIMLLFAGVMVFSAHKDDQVRMALKNRCTETVEAKVTSVVAESHTRTRRSRRRTYHETYTVYVTKMVYKYKDNAYEAVDKREDVRVFNEGQTVNIGVDPDAPEVYYIARANDGEKMKLSLIPAGFIAVISLILFISALTAKKGKTVTNKTNFGKTYEEWAAEQNAKKAAEQMQGIADADINNYASDEEYMKSLNKTDDYMDSI